LRCIFKIILLALLLSLTGNLLAQEYWLKQSSPTNQKLNNLSFIDSLHGWVSGDSGVILHTSNGGANWNIQETGLNDRIWDIFFIDENTGWATGFRLTKTAYFPIMLKTTNGGINWINYLYPDTNQFFYAIHFINQLTGWAGGDNGKIVKTTDGGTSWFDTYPDSTIFSGFPVFKISFYSESYGYAIGGANDISGVVWRTTNGGLNWSVTGGSVLGSEPYFGIKYFDSLNIQCVGGDFDFGSSIIRSSNGGLSWDYEVLGIFGFASALSYRTKSEGWSPLGFERKFMYTFDGGENWQTITTPDSMEIYDVIFTDTRNGFAIGEKGTILKYNTELINISNIYSEIPNIMHLYQNYPNPFNPGTNIRYDIHKPSEIKLRVFNVIGKELKIIDQGFKLAGSYLLNLDLSDFTSGIYYYNLEVQDLSPGGKIYSETRKFVIVK
jgi:photosystem II stability/assembly factor-like uncharacterized protein